MKSIEVKYLCEIPENYTGYVQFTNGTQIWYKNGIQHREDGPAKIYPDGTQAWCKNGELHREDGPAVIYPDGDQEWWLNEKYYTKEKYYKELFKRGIITEQELFIELL